MWRPAGLHPLPARRTGCSIAAYSRGVTLAPDILDTQTEARAAPALRRRRPTGPQTGTNDYGLNVRLIEEDELNKRLKRRGEDAELLLTSLIAPPPPAAFVLSLSPK